MKNNSLQLNHLKANLQNAAFLVSKGNSEREAHAEILNCLILVKELEESRDEYASTQTSNSNEEIANEIKKVERKLGKWVSKQWQINTKILNAYLELERSGETHITEEAINAIAKIKTFTGNFNGMKLFGEKNHCKVFEMVGEQVTIWKPIEKYVRKYEEAVFG